MKRFLLFPLFIILSSLFIFFWWNSATQPPRERDIELHRFVIPRGMAASQIADKLQEEGFIRSPLAFRFYVQITSNASRIKAGDYRLTKKLTLSDLVSKLTMGPIGIWVAIPEGLRREEVGLRVVDGLELSGVQREDFLQEFFTLTRNKEGFLFPDTYLFLRTTTPEIVVNKLTETFEQKVDVAIIQQAAEQGLTLAELITLASIVERETRTSEERPIVAGILLKRLQADWPLQVDATLQYAVASVRCQVSSIECEWWPTITSADKKISSSYNTYARFGLPSGPIAAPGLSSIKAVANPISSSYWFYLHDGEGKIRYAATSQEHQENIRKYLQ